MATQTPTSSAPSSRDQANMEMLKAAFVGLQNVKPGDKKAMAAAVKVLQKSLLAIGVSEKEAEALAKLVSEPGETAHLAVTTMMNLAQKNGDQLIELKKKWADAFMRQGDSIAGIASAARAIATIASFFGAEDFAVMLNTKADEQMAKAEMQYAIAKAKMQEDTGASQVVRDYVKQTLEVIKSGNFVAATAEVANSAAHATQPNPITVLDDGDAPNNPVVTAAPAANVDKRALTKSQFTQNLDALKVNKSVRAELLKTFDDCAKFDVASKGAKTILIDTNIERDMLSQGIAASKLTEAQKDKLYKKLNLPTPEPVAP